jgi:hypothetical protein
MKNKKNNVLFWIIGGVSKNTWKYPSEYSVWALEHDSMAIGMNKFCVQEMFPACMKCCHTTLGYLM